MSRRYEFITPSERTAEKKENPNKVVCTFTQVCTYKNQYGRYPVRQFKLNADNEFVSIKDFELNKIKLKILLKGLNPTPINATQRCPLIMYLLQI